MLRLLSTALLAILLTGCSAGAPMPTPSPTPDVETAPEQDAVDPRCLREFPGLEAPVFEGDVPVRPTFWPTAPPFAALCSWAPESPVESIGYYATDEFMTMDQVFDYYEQQFDSPDREVVHGRSPIEYGEVLHGVYPPVSFYIEYDGRNRYKIYWAEDGQYEVGNE